MTLYTENHSEIKSAINDLKKIIGEDMRYIENIQLFGSALTIPIEDAKDIDFFISYKGIDFDTLRNKLMGYGIERNVAVENHEATYSNCPIWSSERPLTLHIILYRKGESKFSDKLIKTKEKSVDITKEFK